MKKVILVSLALVLLAGCTNTTEDTSNAPNVNTQQGENTNKIEKRYISIKYREDPVNIAHPRFEYLDTSKSSFVRGAWYDENNEYMIINLKGTNYHYCSLSPKLWSNFRRANSFGTFYNKYIYENYDCRYNYVPEY